MPWPAFICPLLTAIQNILETQYCPSVKLLPFKLNATWMSFSKTICKKWRLLLFLWTGNSSLSIFVESALYCVTTYQKRWWNKRVYIDRIKNSFTANGSLSWVTKWVASCNRFHYLFSWRKFSAPSALERQTFRFMSEHSLYLEISLALVVQRVSSFLLRP